MGNVCVVYLKKKRLNLAVAKNKIFVANREAHESFGGFVRAAISFRFWVGQIYAGVFLSKRGTDGEMDDRSV